jgi:hypothetical protein
MVSDMQIFQFEVCMGIPALMKAIYRNSKTSCPRGQGSPQSELLGQSRQRILVSWWIQQARVYVYPRNGEDIVYYTSKDVIIIH